jgi:hypothetical protein
MHVHSKTTRLTGRSFVIGSVLASVSLTMTGQGQDRQIINEPGGIGVNQFQESMAASSSSALILFTDDRSGESLTRLRAIDAYGNVAETSSPVESLLEPEHGFRNNPQIVMSADGEALLSWSSGIDPYYGKHRLAWIDVETGLPLSIGHEVGAHDAVHVSDTRTLILMKKEGTTLQARFMDESFTMTSGPVNLVDESDLEFSNGISRHDVAFRPDGSFMLSWVGTQPPYFDEVKSQLFDASGSPTGPINVHSIDDDLSFTDCRLVRRHNDSFVVMWPDHDGTFGQRIDSKGHAVGSPSLMWQSEGDLRQPEDIGLNSTDQLALISTNGLTIVDAESLAPQNTIVWGDGTSANSMMWFQDISSALEIREVQDDAGDQDIIGWRHDIEGNSVDLGLMADDVDGAHQTHPCYSGNSQGSKVISWLDNRTGANGRIGYKLFDSYGNAVGADRFLEVPGRRLYTPLVSMNEIGEFVISWMDVDAEDLGDVKSLKYQRFDDQGQSIGISRLIHTESGFLEPIFTPSWFTQYKTRGFLLLDNGNIFTAWSMSIVTGGTIGNPIYGRKEIYTKSFTASDHIHAAGINNFLGGNIHALIESGESSATLYYYAQSTDVIRTAEFFADGQPRVNGSLPPTPEIGGNLNTAHHVTIAIDEHGTSITWSEQSSGFGDRCFTAHYDPDGELVASDILPGENTFSWLALNQDGTRTVVHGNGQSMFVTLLHPSGSIVDDPEQIDKQQDYVIGHTGFTNFQIMLTGERLELIRSVASGTDQASEIELTTYQVDLDSCAPADFNCDGSVNGADLARLLAFWGMPEVDLDGDGTTNGSDLTILLGLWTS